MRNQKVSTTTIYNASMDAKSMLVIDTKYFNIQKIKKRKKQFFLNPKKMEEMPKKSSRRNPTRTQSVPKMLIANAIAENILGLPRIAKNSP